MEILKAEIFQGLINKYKSLAVVFKTFFLLVILFLVFFGISLIISIKNKPQSAYTFLSSERSKLMLQDTRMHNWNEIEGKEKNNKQK